VLRSGPRDGIVGTVTSNSLFQSSRHVNLDDRKLGFYTKESYHVRKCRLIYLSQHWIATVFDLPPSPKFWKEQSPLHW
jgi:hypothetical protein